MRRIVVQADIDALQLKNITPSLWTAVIPAAGRGSRLGYDSPKILYPVLEKSLLAWLWELLEPLCCRIVLVVSPSGEQEIAHASEAIIPKDRISFAVQPVPLGMADAVQRALPMVSTANTLLIWGDQISLTPRTIINCQLAHEARNNAMLTFPTVLRDAPYINVLRDEADRILRIEEAREGTISVIHGENDCGLFLFDTRHLRETLQRARAYGLGIGAKTGEYNLLPLLPEFETADGSVVTVRTASLEETQGINTQKEAIEVAGILMKKLS